MARPRIEDREQRSIYVPVELARKIQEYAEQQGISWNEAHRRVLQRYFALLVEESEGGRVASLEKRRDILLQEIRENEDHLLELEKSVSSTRERLKRLRGELVRVEGELEEARVLEERWERFVKDGSGEEWKELRDRLADVLFKWAFDNLQSPSALSRTGRRVLAGVVDSDAWLLDECQRLFGRKPSACLDVVWDFEKGGLKKSENG